MYYRRPIQHCLPALSRRHHQMDQINHTSWHLATRMEVRSITMTRTSWVLGWLKNSGSASRPMALCAALGTSLPLCTQRWWWHYRRFSQWTSQHLSPPLPSTGPHLLKPVFKVSKASRRGVRSALRGDTALSFRSGCPHKGRMGILTCWLWLRLITPKFSLYNNREYRKASDIQPALRHVQDHTTGTHFTAKANQPHCTSSLKSPPSYSLSSDSRWHQESFSVFVRLSFPWVETSIKRNGTLNLTWRKSSPILQVSVVTFSNTEAVVTVCFDLCNIDKKNWSISPYLSRSTSLCLYLFLFSSSRSLFHFLFFSFSFFLNLQQWPKAKTM